MKSKITVNNIRLIFVIIALTWIASLISFVLPIILGEIDIAQNMQIFFALSILSVTTIASVGTIFYKKWAVYVYVITSLISLAVAFMQKNNIDLAQIGWPLGLLAVYLMLVSLVKEKFGIPDKDGKKE
ncbi:MAG: hypothetical protein AAF621_02980 [Pseudomonadota bacterium]